MHIYILISYMEFLGYLTDDVREISHMWTLVHPLDIYWIIETIRISQDRDISRYYS